MAAIVSIVSEFGLTIKVHSRNQPNKSKLVLCKPLFHSNLKQMYKVTSWSTSVIKVGVVYVGIYVLRHLKEKLGWATDTQLLGY